MRRVRGKNTKPELSVRRAAFALGLRYRLHQRELPGRPDLVFASRRKVVFVHGCFWHRHAGCRRASMPTTNGEFWLAKFARNVERDARCERELQSAGWEVLVVWECQAKDADALQLLLGAFLRSGGGPPKETMAEPTTTMRCAADH
jgi:DNA mismatch endonuclease (patch repair protein)